MSAVAGFCGICRLSYVGDRYPICSSDGSAEEARTMAEYHRAAAVESASRKEKYVRDPKLVELYEKQAVWHNGEAARWDAISSQRSVA